MFEGRINKLANSEIEATKQNKTKQNKTKQNKTKQNKTKQNKTKQNKTKCDYYCPNQICNILKEIKDKNTISKHAYFY